MDVLVTGAAGVIGRVVVTHLSRAGHCVAAADRVPYEGPAAALSLVGDTRDPDFADRALHAFGPAMDAVVHLAAIPAPGQVPELETLTQNLEGAYVMVDAAGRAGLRHVVAASSFSAYGYPWADRDLSPPYVPIDEDQPTAAIDSYGLSKVLTEQVAAFATRRWGMSTTLLRFPFVGHGDRLAARLADIAQDPAAGRRDLWTWLDTRDAARAVATVLDVAPAGHRVFNIAAPDTTATVPTADLLKLYHPDTEVRAELDGFATPLDLTAARRDLGFETQHTWR